MSIKARGFGFIAVLVAGAVIALFTVWALSTAKEDGIDNTIYKPDYGSQLDVIDDARNAKNLIEQRNK